MSLSNGEQDTALWNEYLDAFRSFGEVGRRWLAETSDRVGVVRAGLRKGSLAQAAALRLFPSLKVEEQKQLFDDLVRLSLHHGLAWTIRELIGELPRAWVLAHIEEAAEPHLQDGTYDEYRRILELYSTLDWNLTQKLARRAAAHSDPDIKEAGEDYLTGPLANGAAIAPLSLPANISHS